MYRVNWSSLYKYTYIEGLVNILPAFYVYKKKKKGKNDLSSTNF
jgi:hypothetical protein